MNERGWWQKYAGLIASEYADLIGLEAEARTIRTYQQELAIPGRAGLCRRIRVTAMELAGIVLVADGSC